jgi:hypothetical protein
VRIPALSEVAAEPFDCVAVRSRAVAKLKVRHDDVADRTRSERARVGLTQDDVDGYGAAS